MVEMCAHLVRVISHIDVNKTNIIKPDYIHIKIKITVRKVAVMWPL